MRLRGPAYASLAAAWLACAPPAAAHHSTAFYTGELVELQGELVRIDWINPHVRFVLRTTAADGSEKLYRMEASAISALQRRGVSRDLFKVGDRVTIAAHPSSRNPLELQLTNVLLKDGREASLWLDAPPRFAQAGAQMIRSADTVVDAAQENRGLFRVWTPPRPFPLTPAIVSIDQPFTTAAVEARKQFDLLDNFATRCEPGGMPAVMFAPLPYELADRGATIELKAEVYDTVRTIHMDRAAPPPNEPASMLGYSVGKWDDGDLVVTTTRVNWPYYDTIGTPQSAAVEIVERFKLSADQARVDVDIAVRDAANLTAPATLTTTWLALGHEVQRFDCQLR
jgi:uncharacterized protein DUF6152